ncbi:PilX N-terminal domain-containing pilus assembly protein [Pseudomonas boanensis]|uniref:PilX N-terminal domain-containing pilus assembly protein n=1 Tax=Metapseudomonas boanensis TaxID=2822138 RepID=UPI0035D43F85
MMKGASRPDQQGATLVVGLIMLLMLTLLVGSAFTMSGSSLKSVGNMQAREEALAAANIATEQVVSSPFTDAPTAESINVDINNDGVTDYTVNMAVPICISETELPVVSEDQLSGIRAGVVPPDSQWSTVWELAATVTDPASGASTRVRSGVRVLLSESEKESVCP